MAKFCTFFLLLTLGYTGLNAQNTYNLELLATWNDPNGPIASPGNLNLKYSGCWGMAVNGREYGILGGAGDIFIFDVTDPNNVFLRKRFPRPFVTIWREFKSYNNRLYAVTDGVDEGLTIYDFSQAPDTIIETYSSTEFFNKSHTITLDTVSGNVYLNGGSSGQGITILNVKDNPDAPVFVTKIQQLTGGYIHDSYVRNDTLYASSGNSGYFIYDFKTDVMNPKFIASVSTGGYNHNSWLTADGRYAYYTEEIPKGRPVQIVDLVEMNTTGQVELVGNGFLDNLVPGGTEAIPHNVYIKDNLLFNSQYEDGLLVYDISNPTAPVLLTSYDTHTQNSTYNGYFGNWGNYPWLPSGNIVAGDMQNGFFLFKLTNSTNSTQDIEKSPNIVVAPNPANDEVVISFTESTKNWQYTLINNTGQRVRTAANISGTQARIALQGVPAGLYTVVVSEENGFPVARKLVVH